MQKNWIGKSFGCEINFKIEGENQLKNKMFYYKTRYFIWIVFFSISVDHPISKFYENDEEFYKI